MVLTAASGMSMIRTTLVGEFAVAEHVEAIGDEFLFDRGGVGEGGQLSRALRIGNEPWLAEGAG